MNNKFKIRLHSGLGDVFRLLSEHTSIDLFYKTHGLKLYWVYEQYDLKDYENPEQYTDSETRPMCIIVHDILRNVPFLKLVSQDEFNDLDVPELDNWYNRSEDVEPFRLRGLFSNERQGFKIPLLENEDLEIKNLINLSKKTICVHVSGRDKIKNYSVDNYVKLFQMLFEKYTDLTIFLIDRPGKTIDSCMLFDPRIINLIDKISRVQEINLIQKVDYLIAPCSYSKYVRRWVNGKQIILLCHYTYMSDSTTLSDIFGHYKYAWRPGLLYNPNITLLGATYPREDDLEVNFNRFNDDQCSIVKNINYITPEEIFNSIDKMNKILYVNGCSQSAGSEITNPGDYNRYPENIKKSYAGQLAARWGHTQINDAVPGQDNGAIVSQTIHSILNLLDSYSNTDIVVLIGWAGLERRFYIHNGEWYKFCPGMGTPSNHVKIDFERWVVNSNDDVSINKFSIDYITLVNFLELNKIEYYMFNASFNRVHYPFKNFLHHMDENKPTMKLFKHMTDNPRYFYPFDDNSSMISYLMSKGHDPKKEGRGHHFAEDAHTEWADVLESWIKLQK